MAATNVQALIDQITADDSVIDSAVLLINGFTQRLTDAVNLALANGVSAADLKPLTDEIALQKSKADVLAAAVAANTVAPPAPTPAPTPAPAP